VGGKITLMKSIFFSFLNSIVRFARAYPIIFFVIFVIICSLILGGRHVWKQHHKNSDIVQTTQTAPPSSSIIPIQEKTDKIVENEEEEDDETEDEKDDSDTVSASPWPILKTALHDRYYEPSSKQQSTSVAIILTGLGLNKTFTQQLLTTFDKRITLAFSPYSPSLKEQLQNAMSSGYQVIATLPMEPHNYPNPDPGPYTVLTSVKTNENQLKINRLLDNIPPGIGILGEYGSKFLSSHEDLKPVLLELKNRGHSFIDPNTTMLSQAQNTCKGMDMPCFQVDYTLSQDADTNELHEFVKNIIQNSKENGTIIISVPVNAAVAKQMPEWIDKLNKHGINLVTIAGKSLPELTLDTSSNDQGSKDAAQ
jgi:hypothetical protein